MYYHPILRQKAQRQLKKIGQADLVIGLPSYKNPDVAARVARVALAGADQYYPDLQTVLINADAGAAATTRRAVEAQSLDNGSHSLVVSGRYHGPRARDSAVAAILDAALALDAKAIIILDSQSAGVTSNWVAGLAHLILTDKADLVLPRYRQWAFPQGAVCDLVAYPLLRALWGASVRYPLAPDFALTPKLATALLDEDIWETSAGTFGLAPWLVTYGLLKQWRVAQSALGQKPKRFSVAASRKRREKSRITKRAETRFREQMHAILDVTFSLAYQYQEDWQSVEQIRSLPTLTEFASTPAHDAFSSENEDVTQLLDNLALGWIEYRLLWKDILTPENLAQIETLATFSPDRFYFPADLWARIIYDFVVVFNKGELDPVKVVASFFPIYQARLAAFSQEVAGLAFVGHEGTVAAQAVEFEEARPYFKERWRVYQPGNDKRL